MFGHCCTATLHYHQSYSHNLTQYFVFLLFCFLCLPHPFFHTIKSPPTKGFLKISTSTKKSPLAQIFTRRPTHCCHRLTHTEPSVLCCVNALAHSQSPPLAPGKELVISLLPAAAPWFTNPLIGAIQPISGFERFRLRGKEWSTIEDGCRGKVVHDEHIKDGNWWLQCRIPLIIGSGFTELFSGHTGGWSTAAEKPKVPNKVFHTQHVVHFLLPETVRREKEDTVTQLQCKMTSHLETEGEQCRHWEKLQ